MLIGPAEFLRGSGAASPPHCRADRERRDRDPDRRRAALEGRRIDAALRRERAGDELVPADRPVAPETGEPRLPAAPFVAWIRTRWPSAGAAAESVDLDPCLLRAYLDGTGLARGISLRIVDHAVTRAGCRLHDVYDAEAYPDLYE